MTDLPRTPALVLAALVLAAGVLSSAARAQSPAGTVVKTEQVRAELMAHASDGAQPGKTVWVGLQLTHQPHWHTYWKNSGDSGLPTVLQWTLPPGVQAAEIDWPVPRKIPIGNLANYGYEGTVLLPVRLTIGPDFKPSGLSDALTVGLKANWLVCRKECIPEEGEFALQIPLRGSTALNGAAFEAAFAAQPRPILNDPLGILPPSKIEVVGQTLQLAITGLPMELRGKTLDFFPETPEVIETGAVLQTAGQTAPSARAWTQGWNGSVWQASVPLSSQREASPAVMPVVLALDQGGQRLGYRAEVRVIGNWPAVATAAAAAPALETALPDNLARSGPGIGLLAALAGALLGGLLLNLMPCVFPVLSIKLVEFARHAQDRRAQRISGVAYSAGVLLSFLALGGLMLGLRSAGEQLGWGFQLQSPTVVAGLAVLFTLLGLNLAGMFEFGQFLPARLSSHQARNPALNAFLSGVLAVAVASPCTAPFMGAALGLALGLPTWQALSVFAFLGLGMALPYLAASAWPALARALPRPGVWMAHFKTVMAFPMLATVVWLVWVLGQQTGIDGAAALLLLLLVLGFAAWAWGSPQLGARGRTGFGIVAGVLLVLTAAWAWPTLRQDGAAATSAHLATKTAIDAAAAPRSEGTPTGLQIGGSPDWQPWTRTRVTQAQAQGQPVFVDFTAAWCVTCQFNKRTTLANAEVQALFAQKLVLMLRADWTRRDPAISAQLSALQRSGVPVYALYTPGQARPQLLSEILTVEEVRNALHRLPPGSPPGLPPGVPPSSPAHVPAPG